MTSPIPDRGPRMLVLVTGTRYATDQDHAAHIWDAISDNIAGHPGPHFLIHGDAGGVDAICGRHALQWGLTPIAVPANWTGPCRKACRHGARAVRRGVSICPAAGPYRNQDMVDRVADLARSDPAWGAVCLAFPAVNRRSAGTGDCMKRAEAAGITVPKPVSLSIRERQHAPG